MDLDNLITLIMLFLFFILPSLLKGKGKKKKTTSKAQKVKKKKGFSIFGKINEAIQEFVKELEKQALEAKKQEAQRRQQEQTGEKASGTFWDGMDDEELEFQEDHALGREQVPEQQPVPSSFDPDHPFISPKKTQVKKTLTKPDDLTVESPTASLQQAEQHFKIQGGLPSHALQQAVVWSEILGKPVALRDN
ncbi:MAG: hypothetical protein MI892_31525 [Desulfobacterales bacterium]|nr:hypothetical protein [Desulfobacterales bacterium]